MDEIVTPDQILTRTKTGKWLYKGEELDQNQIENLVSEAELISKTSLWRIMVKEGKYHAQKRVIIDAKAEEDDTKKLAIIKEAHAYHDVVLFFEKFISNFTNQ